MNSSPWEDEEQAVRRWANESDPPGWYRDPSGVQSHEAYWDGARWTGATRPPGGRESQKLSWIDVLFRYKGRISVGVYWLAYVIAWVVAALLILPFWGELDAVDPGDSPSAGATLVTLVAGVWLFWTFTALAAKRMQDRDMNGLLVFLNAVPFIGWIVWIVLTLLPSSNGPNKEGPAPGFRWARD